VRTRLDTTAPHFDPYHSSAETSATLEIGDKEIQELTRFATAYALAYGLSFLPAGDVPPAPTSVTHAPFALFLTPLPRSKLAQKPQPLWNVLYARVATNEKFLDEVMDRVGKVK